MRDPATHREVLKMAEGMPWRTTLPRGLDFSPIKRDPRATLEYLMYVQHCACPAAAAGGPD